MPLLRGTLVGYGLYMQLCNINYNDFAFTKVQADNVSRCSCQKEMFTRQTQ